MPVIRKQELAGWSWTGRPGQADQTQATRLRKTLIPTAGAGQILAFMFPFKKRNEHVAVMHFHKC